MIWIFVEPLAKLTLSMKVDPDSTWPIDVERVIRAKLANYDDMLLDFAHDYVDGQFVRDYHGQISRHINCVGDDGITRSIQITAILKKPAVRPTAKNWIFSIGAAAWKDIYQDRLFWSKHVRQIHKLPTEQTLRRLLTRVWVELKRIKRSDLKSAKQVYGLGKIR